MTRHLNIQYIEPLVAWKQNILEPTLVKKKKKDRPILNVDDP